MKLEIESKGEIHTERNTEKTEIVSKAEAGVGYKTENLFFENRIERAWLSTVEAARFLAVSANALYIMVNRNQVVAYKFGRRLRFRFKDCQALIQKKGAN